MGAQRALYQRILVSALAAEIQALSSAGGTMAAQRTWYNKAVGIRHKKRRSSDEQRIDF